MKAVVLAAGEGKRLRPLTEKHPKPMLPVANAPILEHVIDALVDAGVEEMILVVGYNRERIQNYFGDGTRFGIDIRYVVQEPRLGTGDALLQVEEYIGGPFLVLNGNQIVEPSLLSRLITLLTDSGEICISVARATEPERYGVVTLDGNSVETFVEKPQPHAVESELVSVGAYGFTPDVFAALRKLGPGSELPGELQITDVIQHFLDRPIRAVRYDGMWLELTKPWDLLTANAKLLQRRGSQVDEASRVDPDTSVTDPIALGADVTLQSGARVLPSTSLGTNVTVAPNAVIRNSVVLPDVTIGPGAVVQNAIIGSGSTLGSNVTIEDGVTDILIDGTVYPDVRFGALIGDRSVLGANTTTRLGAIIGNDVRIESASVVDGRLPSGTHVKHG